MSKPKPVMKSQQQSEPTQPQKSAFPKKQVGTIQSSNSSDAKNIPLMFQAQIKDRGNIQYAGDPTGAEKWIDQWLKGCPSVPERLDEDLPIWKRRPVKPSVKLPEFGANVHTWEYQIRWRMVTNGGQDEGIIRPAIGAKGMPFFPGSSMKGAFRRACPEEKRIDYCGGEVISAQGEKQLKPGILRFHGGYPTDMTWGQSNLLDIAHGQEKYQVQDGSAKHNANVQISLYKPKFKFGISSIKEISTSEWNEIQQIWEVALGDGIGSRVSAGYGCVEGVELSKPILLSVHLNGKGLTSQLLSSKPVKPYEFRPNMFKATLRGHTLRLLAGITDEETTKVLTKKLWGGIDDGAVVGCVGIDFRIDGELELREHSYQPPNSSRKTMSTYDLRNGRLDLLKVANITPEAERFVESLVKFSMLLGGFGKSWRRVHHGLFYPDYFTKNDKPMIGCHWGFADESKGLYVTENQNDLGAVKKFLMEVQEKTISWVKSENKKTIGQVRTWREAWYSENVQVWGRIAKNAKDCEAVHWFHGPYEGSRSIYKSELTGKMGQIGRMWHRMYPRYLPPTAEKMPPKDTGEFIELLTIFPNRSGNDVAKTQEFLDFLRDRSDFEKLW